MQRRVGDSTQYLADNLERVPVFLIPCFTGRIDGQPASVQAGAWGSLLPAVWSFMLAARVRGLGTAWTMLHMRHERAGRRFSASRYEQSSRRSADPGRLHAGPPISNPRIGSRLVEYIVHWDSW